MKISHAGVVALVFLILGYEISLFVHKAAATKLLANQDKPDTVWVMPHQDTLELTEAPAVIERHNAQHKPEVTKVVTQARGEKKVENFRFNPNTVSLGDLQRLGFTERQAQSIINYREKGGRFRRKSDFARSFVVADSVYARLEPYIYIPKIDINKADTTELKSLPGIGSWYAKRIVEYRGELHGYSYPEQLMDLWKFNEEKYNNLSDLITCSKPIPYDLWRLPEDSLKLHPYIKWSAHAIVLYREHTDTLNWTVDKLIENNILKPEYGNKLKRCYIAEPSR